MNILVTGGAGYIASFMSKRLLDDGYTVTIADSLERGFEKAIDKRAVFKKGNLTDEQFLTELFSSTNFDAIIHFAAYISMGESMQNPYIYFANNTNMALKLLEAAREHNVKKFIFSSTAGVYGNPVKVPISEDHSKNPENPYGESKLMVESLLKWYQRIHGMNYAVLRYFNACGASLDGTLGENHEPETHIIPNAIKAVLYKKPFTLFGNDYKTPDGTCVRDYIHVLDLVEAHVLALKKLQNEQGGFTYNVGTGKGFSNKEVLDMVKKISGEDLHVEIAQRRPGDAEILVADVTKINTELNFVPKYSDLETIVKTAWEWHKKNFKPSAS
ncbi:UDP-glucose 4-epimerase GalE [Candidatus Roizmanbacteria bacterium]|nr:UDP-glucose 4-epimerase GalE [Candidatus Roizmanbacteria bacterium]